MQILNRWSNAVWVTGQQIAEGSQFLYSSPLFHYNGAFGQHNIRIGCN